jgi:methylenetetrahydrofolate reductase (NADPH)
VFEKDLKITDVLDKPGFTLSAEIIPPRNGAELTGVLTQIERLIASGAQFLSVTKGAGGSLRGGSLPIAQIVKERFKVPCIAHFTCRDLTVQEVENQLIDHHYFGIRNILALRGDPPTDQADWKPKEGGYAYAFQLIEQIRALNEGRYLSRPSDAGNSAKDACEFSIGAAVYPEHPDLEERFHFFARKVEAGAEYGISQMLFDPEIYARFADGLARRGVHAPVLPGTRLLKSRRQARTMAERFAVSVPKAYLDRLPEEPDGSARADDAFFDLIQEFKKQGAPGVHLFVLSDTEASCRALQRLRKDLAP